MDTDSALCEEGSVISYSRYRGYVVGGYETSNISRDRFSQKHNVKMQRVVPDNLFRPRKNMYQYLRKIYKNYEITLNVNLKRQHFPSYCRLCSWVIVSNVQQNRWRCTSTWRWFEEIEHWSLSIQRPLLLCNIPTASTNITISFLDASASCSFQ